MFKCVFELMSIFAPKTQPAPQRPIRLSAAERMKHDHEAAAYDDWLRTKVAVSLAGIEQGTNQRIAPDEWAQIRTGKRVRAA